ncbi:hypothetical protein SAICODRAFT_5656 [Saitoella complicata NRRL Y-17804]|uniref:uncharacterized protein n=1 Tax=Saitoella complicata (strain BCRC 22490 / CBS 7301 / JCM 7358 / NBRC 10748 / NRRL Y-17804) TaxID=698492 RepID=UPI000866D27A|nr:uncharacterized protein SAICODRAFT_5656 [Saitoella complicata NRRL Y-17804]ODQ55041.1 hypothetical protein SAICODRAFT_5656 [Saitoella complicata NRRL Y-17804]
MPQDQSSSRHRINGDDDVPDGSGSGSKKPPKGVPVLPASQRKLRHLTGITIRNISVPDTTPSKARTRPSFSTITSSSTVTSPMRPGLGSLRRRSTRVGMSVDDLADSVVRQAKLEDAMKGRLVDAFFSISVKVEEGTEEVVYVSEKVERTMNPTFSAFDLSSASIPTALSRATTVLLRIFTRLSTGASRWSILMDLKLSLCCLKYLGKNLTSLSSPLPPNTLVFTLRPDEGVYTLPASNAISDVHDDMVGPTKGIAKHKSYSSSSLLNLLTLDHCLVDACASLDTFRNQIATDVHEPSHTLPLEISERAAALEDLQWAVAREKTKVKEMKSRVASLRANIAERRCTLAAAYEKDAKDRSELQSIHSTLAERRLPISEIHRLITKRRADLIRGLCAIYPIAPIPNAVLSFAIRGLLLPDAESALAETLPDENLDTAYGHVAHFLHLLSRYLSIPLRYPLDPLGSRSRIRDNTGIYNISALRWFPLHRGGANSVERDRWDYGVFLLGKDVEQVMGEVGLLVVDLRHMGANLRWLALWVQSMVEERVEEDGEGEGVRQAEVG